jgi:hypothetical protein
MTKRAASKPAKAKKAATARRQSTALTKPEADASELVRELSSMIEAAQKQVATVANAALTLLHWHIGHRVSEYVLDRKRAEYGAQIVSTV